MIYQARPQDTVKLLLDDLIANASVKPSPKVKSPQVKSSTVRIDWATLLDE